jgi:tetratricopeptide (TPR) repeat protein
MDLRRPYLLSRFAVCGRIRFYTLIYISSDTELETAILQSQLWTQWTPYENPDPSILTHAARLMFTRYTSHGSVLDLDDIIALHRRVVHSISLQGTRHFASLNHLAEALCERWYQLTKMNDIEESISLFEEALGLCTSRDERRAIILGNLAHALMYLNMKHTQVSHYSSAISLLRDAISITPLHNDVLAIMQTRLYRALMGYCITSEGQINDLQEVIAVCRGATNLFPIGHRDLPEALLSLARAFHRVNEKEPGTEAKNYTEEARLLWYRILDIQSPTHPRRASCLSSLGFELVSAYHSGRGSKADLDEGVRLIQEAMTLVTPSHIVYPSVLNRLAMGLTARFLHFHKHQEDLDYSITLQERLINALPLSDEKRYNSVHNLATALETRYKHFNDPSDLRRAIDLGREALILCPPGHKDREYSVLTLSRRLILDPNCLIANIDEMVGFVEAVLQDEYKPETNRSGKTVPLREIASLLHARFLRLRDPKDQIRFTELFEAAVQDQASSFGDRFRAAKKWVSAAESLDSPEMAMKAYRMAIHISPYRVYPGLDLSSQLDQLKRDFATISCDAACCALVTTDVSEALTLLEQGRATFWAQRLQLRMSFDALPSDLAERLQSATKKLQEYHSLKRAHNASGEQHLLEQRLHHQAFRQLVQEARLYPGFTDYLRHIQIEQLAGLAEKGPLIVLLSSKTYGSFAIIIRDHSSNVEKLHLSSITADDLQGMIRELQVSVSWGRQEIRDTADEGHARLKLEKGKSEPKGAPNAMARLWSAVGEPIMRHLGIEVSDQRSEVAAQDATQTMFSDARRSTLGHEYGGAAPVPSLHYPSMQPEYQDPAQYTCQTLLCRHTHRPLAVLLKQESMRLLYQ